MIIKHGESNKSFKFLFAKTQENKLVAATYHDAIDDQPGLEMFRNLQFDTNRTSTAVSPRMPSLDF